MGCENKDAVREYYKSTDDAYRRWGGLGGAIHFGYFDNPNGDNITVSEHLASLEKMTEEVFEVADVCCGNKILDAGCGNGGSIHEATKRGAKVWGINITRKQLDRIRNSSKVLKQPEAQLSEADFAEIPFQNDAFDRVIFFESLFHAYDKSHVLYEAERVLRRGGNMVVADYFINNQLTRCQYGDLVDFETGWSGKVVSIDEMDSYVKNCGFSEFRCINVTKNTLPSIKIAAKSAARHDDDPIPANPLRQKHRNATINLYRLMSDGVLGYYIIRADK